MSTPSPQESTPHEPGADAERPLGRVAVVGAPERLVVRMDGEIDDELRLDLDDAAAEVGRRHRRDAVPVHVDATGVTFMDSTGAAFLARLAVAVRPARVTVHPSQPVAFLMDLTRLADVLDVAPGTPDAF
ncbi:STAS domain-containing protein [Kineococcus sp. SYSU DK003]|uniref:STAS domain-containing protein n=1 Tax=Kineococcus sp. SYSU DK003 TaxID=3383124 RepID=UPI003D7CE19E